MPGRKEVAVRGESLHQDELLTLASGVRGGWDRGGGDVGMFGVVLFLP